MKVEKINNGKAKITLTFEELKKKKITLNDIKNNKSKAQDFFLELLEDARLLEEFEADTNELFIEASKENDLFTVTITKMSEIKSSKILPSASTTYKISSNIYYFKNIDCLKDFESKCYELGLYLPSCSLYNFNNKFYLVFKKNHTLSLEFVKTFSVLSEYADSYYSSRTFNDILSEYGSILLENTNTSQILEYPYFLT